MPLHAATKRRPEASLLSADDRNVCVRVGAADWCLRAGWGERLLGADAPDWFNLQTEPRAELAKRGYSRRTWRVALGDRTIFAKVVRVERFLERVKVLLLGSAGEREWRVSREAEARGVSVVRSLAIGALAGRPPQWALLTEGLDEAVTVREAWAGNVGPIHRCRRRGAAIPLIEAVARLFADAHERGFVHRDGHPNNIMVHRPRAGEPVAVYVDLHSSRLGRHPASAHQMIRALAQLDHSFRRTATRTDRLRFLRSYLGRRSSTGFGWNDRGRLRKWLDAVARERKAHAERLARQRDRRLCRNGKYFSTIPLGGGWKATVVLQPARRHAFAEPDVPDRSESEWRAILEPLVEMEIGGQPGEHLLAGPGLGLEVARLGALGERLNATLRGSLHRQAFQRCHWRRHRDLSSELILAYGEHRRAGLVDATFLVRPSRSESQSVVQARQVNIPMRSEQLPVLHLQSESQSVDSEETAK